MMTDTPQGCVGSLVLKRSSLKVRVGEQLYEAGTR